MVSVSQAGICFHGDSTVYQTYLPPRLELSILLLISQLQSLQTPPRFYSGGSSFEYGYKHDPRRALQKLR